MKMGLTITIRKHVGAASTKIEVLDDIEPEDLKNIIVNTLSSHHIEHE